MNGSADRARILVVDDDPTTVSFITDLLSENGFTPLPCATGREAIEIIGREPVDLVVLDVRLPDVSGIEVARRLRAQTTEDDFTPIIMLSALSAEEDRITGLQVADDYVSKPFSGVELLARIRAFLRIRTLHRSLAQSRRLYRELYENAPYMHVSLDAAFRVLWCNKAFAETVGIAADNVRGKAFEAYFMESDRASLRDVLAAVAKGNGQRDFRVNLISGRKIVPVEVRVVRTSSGLVSEPTLVAVMQDVDRKVRIEEEQKTARQRLYRSARLTSLGMLASGVAHELNNPLTAILGFSSALLERVKRQETIPTTDLRDYLEVIYNETIRCRDVITTLSSFAMEHEGHSGTVSLLDCVNAAIRLLQPRAQAHGLVIENRITSDTWVRVDGSRLGQVFVNIINNSIDFCQGKGRVVLEAEMESPSNPGCVMVRVRDDGPGIPAENLPRVFDPFFTTKEVGKGTGLGLTMCHSILKDIGGAIDIISTEGQGTTVILEIPRAEATT